MRVEIAELKGWEISEAGRVEARLRKRMSQGVVMGLRERSEEWVEGELMVVVEDLVLVDGKEEKDEGDSAVTRDWEAKEMRARELRMLGNFEVSDIARSCSLKFVEDQKKGRRKDSGVLLRLLNNVIILLRWKSSAERRLELRVGGVLPYIRQ